MWPTIKNKFLTAVGFEPQIDLVDDHLFHELQLLHPHWAGDFDEQRAIADLLWLGVARNGFTDDLVPDRPDAVLIEALAEIKSFERMIEDRAETFHLLSFLNHFDCLGRI